MSLAVHTVKAFSRDGQGGNAAGVVLEPITDDAQKQRMAKQAGYSETAFVEPSDLADFRVRFFTPAEEVDFCGHATVGTFHLMAKLGHIQPGTYTQETKAGLLRIDIHPDYAIWMTQTLPQFGPTLEPETIAASLNIPLSNLLADVPIQVVSTGLPDILVPVKDMHTLWALQPNFDHIRAISEQYDVTGYHVFSLDTLMTASTAHCRNFAPRFAIDEESATGSASGALASYLVHYGLAKGNQPLQFEQGDCMKQPSLIHATIHSDNNRITQVCVGGQAYMA
jgi:PhzF family phenazine biosynthesis protein